MKKVLKGKVVATKMQRTVVVEVSSKNRHPLYGKILTRSKRFKVDAPDGGYAVGDTVAFVKTRPISKDKHFAVVKEEKKA